MNVDWREIASWLGSPLSPRHSARPHGLTLRRMVAILLGLSWIGIALAAPGGTWRGYVDTNSVYPTHQTFYTQVYTTKAQAYAAMLALQTGTATVASLLTEESVAGIGQAQATYKYVTPQKPASNTPWVYTWDRPYQGYTFNSETAAVQFLLNYYSPPNPGMCAAATDTPTSAWTPTAGPPPPNEKRDVRQYQFGSTSRYPRR